MTTTGTIAIRNSKAPILYQGRNGEVSLRLRADGSLVMAWKGDPGSTPDLDMPVSVDVKITDRCSLGCGHCHESSGPRGEHGDLWALGKYLKELPPGAELAIGGGNPLAHLDLEDFLRWQGEIGHVCNLTVNARHIRDQSIVYAGILSKLVSARLVLGIGVSVDPFDVAPQPIKWLEDMTGNVIYHVIAGIHDPRRLQALGRILVLGYKRHGRGAQRNTSKVEQSLELWRELLSSVIAEHEVGFDTAAVDQLDVAKLATPREWTRHYLGRDGEMTMFVDGVTRHCAASSIHPRIPWTTVREDFQRIRSEVVNDCNQQG